MTLRRLCLRSVSFEFARAGDESGWRGLSSGAGLPVFPAGGFHRFTTNIYEYLSKGLEMFYLFAFSFGGRSAAATVHCAYPAGVAAADSDATRGASAGRGRESCAAMLLYLVSRGGDRWSQRVYGRCAGGDGVFGVLSARDMARKSARRMTRRSSMRRGSRPGFCFAIKFTGVVAVFYAIRGDSDESPAARAGACAGCGGRGDVSLAVEELAVDGKSRRAVFQPAVSEPLRSRLVRNFLYALSSRLTIFPNIIRCPGSWRWAEIWAGRSARCSCWRRWRF